MTKDQVKDAAKTLKQCLGDGPEIRNIEAKTLEDEYAHLRFMCSEIPNILDQDKIDKAMRWLGFVQGAIWKLGLRSIHDMKNDNR